MSDIVADDAPEPATGTGLPFRDTALSIGKRVDDLLGRLTLAEKTALLHQHQPAIARLGVAAFRTGTEALHGLAWLGPATVFPQAVGLASTWNPELVRAVGAAVGDETRGFHHKDPTRGGLNVWAPVVNQLRDPRWGRNEEGYAEDPLLTGVMATAYAGGLRGDHDRFLKTAPTLKHFLAYNNETRRDTTSSNLGPRVLHEYELPAFRTPIEAGAAVAVMASYNLVNGRPAHLSPLINDALRRWTGSDLLVVSDAAAPSNVATIQAYYPDHVASHAALVRAGVDSFTDNDDRPELTVQRLTEALELGLLTPADIDEAARRVLAIRFRLGEFDPPEENPFAAITEEVINCPAHQRLARAAAAEAMVLLKNADDTLPLPPAPRRVAVIGPLADTLYEDWYSGTLPYAVTARRGLAERLDDARVEYVEGVDRVSLQMFGPGVTGYVVASADPDGAPLRVVPAAHGVEAHFDIVDWGNGVRALRAAANARHVTVDDDGMLVNDQLRPGGWVVRETFRLVPRGDGETVIRHIASGRYVTVDADGALCARGDSLDDATGFALELVSSGRAAAVTAARDADVAVVVLGNHPLINGRETEDRVGLALPRSQDELLRDVHAANPVTVLVVQSSYPYAIGWAQEQVPAILWSAHGGQEFGHALADVLFGDVAPAGRLTQTWYTSSADLPDLLDYDIVAADATYLYYRDAPLYPFGHGLTYTTFEYDDLVCTPTSVEPDGEITVSVRVTNTGTRESDEVVQLYTRQHTSRVKQPRRRLRDFRRIHLAPGAQTTVTFQLRAADLAFWDVTRGRFVVERARHSMMVGRSSGDIRQAASVTVLGETIPPRSAALVAAIAYDDYSDINLRDSQRDGGDAVESASAASWVGYCDVDFGPTGASTCVARVRADRDAPLTLRLGDPLAGEVIGAITVPAGERYGWRDVTLAVTAPAGIHDLYLDFTDGGTSIESLAFRRP